MTTRFCRFELRTTDVAAARELYAQILGADFERVLEIMALPAEAAARGAPAHVLGHLGVDDVERAARAFVERGATRLGPTRTAADGGDVAIVRDPGGAVVALSTRATSDAQTAGIWHQLNTPNLASVAATYHELFGWPLGERRDFGALGVQQAFAWRVGEASVGSMIDNARRPGIHPHWLFYFRVPALEPTLQIVRDAGGSVIGPMRLPSGDLVAVCEDPQGAAFALRQSRAHGQADERGARNSG